MMYSLIRDIQLAKQNLCTLTSMKRNAVMAINEDITIQLRTKLRMKKLKWIFHKQLESKSCQKHKVEEHYCAMDRIQLPEYLINLIKVGPHLTIRKLDTKILIPNLELLLKLNDSLEVKWVWWRIAENFKKSRSLSTEERRKEVTIKQIRSWLTQKGIICTRDDKSRRLVFLKIEHYRSFLEITLHKQN